MVLYLKNGTEMNVIAFPKAYGSAFCDACFALAGVEAPSGVDIEIRRPGRSEPLGVKRIYATGGAVINVAPYVRGLFAPEPLCGDTSGVVVPAGRLATCYISAPGMSSAAVELSCGTEDAPSDAILSTAPRVVKIRPGERDEISVIAPCGLRQAAFVFRHGGVEYIDDLQGAIVLSGMATMVVDANDAVRRFEVVTGASGEEMREFEAVIRIAGVDGEDIRVGHYYVFDRDSKGGRRLAWLNRYGAVDYHTFPEKSEIRSAGGRTRIEVADGYRTVATSSERQETLLSEPCDGSAAEWLAELFSSPAVWTVDGRMCEKAEVADGAVEYSPDRPARVSVTLSEPRKTVSRKIR